VIDTVFEDARARFARGNRVVQFVRVGGAAVFGLVVFINGPVLGVDPAGFTFVGLALAGLILVSGVSVMAFARRGWHPAWAPYAAVLVDCAAITTLGVMAGGANTHLATLLLIVVALNGLRLSKGPLAFAVGCATLSYLIMVRFGEVPERIDRQIVYVGIVWVMGMVAAGTVEMSRHLTRVALVRLKELLTGQMEGLSSVPIERREVSCVTVNFGGFTQGSAQAPPSDIAGALAAAQTALHDLARHHGGAAEPLGPDRARVTFNAAGDLAAHAERAVAFAVDQRSALQDLNAGLVMQGLPLLQPATGIQTGAALAGAMGRPGARRLAALGEPVEAADLLAAVAKPGQIVLGTRTARLTDRATEPFETRPLPGRSQLRFVRLPS
jgi:class 3 adenylate cyclase